MRKSRSDSGDSGAMADVARVHVLLPAAQGERFEAYCRSKGHKKSTLIARLIRDHLDRERFDVQPGLFRDAQQ
jgi:hypothetical protein